MSQSMKPLLRAALAMAVLAPLAARAVDIPVRSDSYTDSANPAANYRSAATLPANDTGKTVFLKFKSVANFLPSGTTSSEIIKAMLHVWVSGSTSNSAHFIVKRAAADWAEGTLTANTGLTDAALPAPFTDSTAINNLPQWVNVDVSDLVKYWVDNPGDPGRSIMLTTTAGEVSLDSKENTDTSHAAFIDVTLAGPGVPVGGSAGQVLSKIDGTDYNTQWVAPAGSDSQNTALGYQALKNNASGVQNLAIGISSLLSNTTGDANTAIGANALNANVSNYGSTAAGYSALAHTTGANNTALGYLAGYTNTTGSNNTFIGVSADASGNNYTNAMAIGNGATVTGSNKVRIGDTHITQIGGQVAWSNLSDGRYKTNIQPSAKGLDFILKLRPVTYQWKEGDTATVYDGFIAQEVEDAMKALGIAFSGLHKPRNDKDHYSLEYSTFVVPLVNAIKTQQALIERDSTEIAGLKQQVAQLAALVNQFAGQAPAHTKP